MNRALLLGFLIFFAVVGVSLMGDQPQAEAGWWHRGYGWGAWYGYPGWHGGYWVVRPVHYYRLHYWGYPAYGYGCCGYPYAYSYGCASWGCYGGCGYYGCCGYSCCGGTVIQGGKAVEGAKEPTPAEKAPTPAEKETPAGVAAPVKPQAAPPPPPAPKPEAPPAEKKAAPAPAPAPEKEKSAAAGDSALLNVRVPVDAAVVINDYTTASKGSVRHYVSRGLQPGMTYRFEVRAEVSRNGRSLSRTRVVELGANQTADLAFDFDAPLVARAGR